MIEVVKGGLILDLGVRGFLPASLVDIRRVQDLDEFLGQELRCKVIELNRSRNNVVLSRRAVLEEERKEQRQQILDRLQPGDVVEGQISNIVDFGAFVDLDGMDGLIHISELSWSHVNHPSEILEIGQTVQVKVLDIDRERQRISLGLKQTQNDPWQQVLESYHENDVVEGRVTKVVTFGAFVEILPGVEGLVHISELAQHHVENPREVVSQGQAVNVKIIEIDGERRRLSLSLKRVEPDDPVQPRADGGESVHLHPNLDLSERGGGDEAAPAAAPAQPVEDAAEPAAEPEAGLGGRDGAAGGSRACSRRAGRRRAGPGGGALRRGVTRPVAVAITGGIGAGKSEALAAFARHGAATVSSDQIVHELLASTTSSGRGRRAARERRRRAGRGARPRRDRDRRLQRPGAARRGSRSCCIRSCRRSTSSGASSSPGCPNPPRVCVTEVPLLYEAGAEGRFDKVVVVTAPTKLRRARSAVATEEREQLLLPDAQKLARADYAYVNTGTLAELEAFVATVMADLTG